VGSHDGSAGNLAPVDVTAYLVLGDNLIAFAASDNYQYWGGYNHQAWLELDDECPSQ